LTQFFVISGSHGVGKTTVAALVRDIMEDRGHAMTTFHHRTDKAAIADASRAQQTNRPTWKRKLWRLIPTSVRAWLVAAKDEVHYARSVTKRVAAATEMGQLAISDRYVYDRLVDLRLHGRPRQQVSAVGAACRLMRKPDMTFLLIDSPARIHARKDELSLTQIAAYQGALKDLFARLHIPHCEIDVAGREAALVAEDIVASIENALQTGPGRDRDQPGAA
jgi:thymidylate kinase